MQAEEFSDRRPDGLNQGSEPHASAVYLVTLVTTGRGPWLGAPRTRDVFLSVLRAWHAARNGRILAATAMPDHAHVLFELGGLLTVSQVVAGWKAGVRRGAGYAETFERELWQYRLHDPKRAEEYALYLFLHPYRARAITLDQSWPGWLAPEPGLFEFTRQLNASGGPPAEWAEWPDEKFAGLAHGE